MIRILKEMVEDTAACRGRDRSADYLEIKDGDDNFVGGIRCNGPANHDIAAEAHEDLLQEAIVNCFETLKQ